MKKTNLLLAAMALVICGCAISPGMSSPSTGLFGENHIYVGGDNKYVEIVDVNSENISSINQKNDFSEYQVGPGDVLTITVWGLPEAFPQITTGYLNTPLNSRTIDINGEIYFPYVGIVNINNLTVNEIRDILIGRLSKQFVNPQLDVTITKYNENRKIFILGEISQPQSFVLGIEKYHLTNAIGNAKGMISSTSNPKKVFVIRSINDQPIIYRLDLSDPSKFIIANNFVLAPKDVIFVGASSITRWNRVVAQLFPFASFINQVDQISAR